MARTAVGRGAALGAGVRAERRGRGAVRRGTSADVGRQDRRQPERRTRCCRHWLDLLAQSAAAASPWSAAAAASPTKCGARRRCGSFDDLSAHNMAVLAMAQTGVPAARDEPDAAAGRAARPTSAACCTGPRGAVAAVRAAARRAGSPTNWGARRAEDRPPPPLDLAPRLNAERLVRGAGRQSCEIDPEIGASPSWRRGRARSEGFYAAADGAAFRSTSWTRAELARMRALLLGEPGTSTTELADAERRASVAVSRAPRTPAHHGVSAQALGIDSPASVAGAHRAAEAGEVRSERAQRRRVAGAQRTRDTDQRTARADAMTTRRRSSTIGSTSNRLPERLSAVSAITPGNPAAGMTHVLEVQPLVGDEYRNDGRLLRARASSTLALAAGVRCRPSRSGRRTSQQPPRARGGDPLSAIGNRRWSR